MSHQASILIVDDDLEMCRLLAEILDKEAYQTTTACSGREALEIIGKQSFDLVISDIKMPDINGIDVLKAVKQTSPETIILMITAFGTIESAISAMKQGAYDYIAKPFRIDEIKIGVKRALDQRQLLIEHRHLQQGLKEKYRFDNIVGSSNEMVEIYKLVAKVSSTRSTVLITGESGTGKELVARAIHFNSPRSEKPFVVVNCSAIPETLIESELFGHVKGAFTGATNMRRGLIEESDGGTCFLDEIGDLGLNVQSKLLRVLQEREIRRVGSDETFKVDIRVIAATNKELELAVKEGKFREDLFYRLSVVSIHLPPLRNRKEDIPLLIHHFLNKYSLVNDRLLPSFAPDAQRLLSNYTWPGNVRELEHVIERAVTLSTSPMIMAEELPPKIYQPQVGVEPQATNLPQAGLTLDEINKQYLVKTLHATDWNLTKTAELLEISVRTIQRMIERYQLKHD
jgi:two-component system, NtrC family, response regulator AtoC